MRRHDHIRHDPDRGDHDAGRLRPGPGRRPALRHQLRRPTARRGHDEATTHRSAPDRGTQERLVLARLHIAGFRRRGRARAPGVKLDCANYDADLDPVNGGSGTLTIGVVRARSNQTPHDAGPAGLHHRLRPAVVDAVAGLAVTGGRRRAAHPPHRRRRPPRHGHVEPDRLPRSARPPDDARSGAIPVRRRPGGQPVRHLQHRHHELHRRHRAGRVGLRQLARRLRHRAAAQPVGRARGRARRDRQRRPGGAGLRRVAPRQGRPTDPRLPDCVGHQRRSRRRATGQGPAGRARRVRRAVRRGELRAGSRSEGRRQRAAGRRACRQGARRRLGGRGGQRHHRRAWASPTAGASPPPRPGQRAGGRPLRRRRPADQPDQPRRRHRDSDGQFVNSCSDALNRPTPDRVRELVVAWGKLYPQFGTVAALNLVKCVHWPTVPPPAPPKDLKIDVLLLGVQNDPIVGPKGSPRRRPRSSTPTRPASG